MGVVITRGRAAVAMVAAVVLVTGVTVTASGTAASASEATTISDCTASAVEAAVTAGGSYVFQCGGTIQLPELTVTRDLTLAGNGYLGVSLSSSAEVSSPTRIFDVESGTLTLDGIDLTGASTATTAASPGTPGTNGADGAAGAAGEEGTVGTPSGTDGGPGGPGKNGTDGDNGGTVSTVAQGGGIYVGSGATVSLDHVTLSNLSAAGGQGGQGGQGGWGGEGGVGGQPGGNCCSIAGNSVRSGGAGGNAGNGGAGGSGGNGGDAQGGAIYVAHGGALEASSTTFQNDQATGGAGGAAGSGGDGGDGGNAGPSAVPPYRQGGAAGNGANAGLPGTGGTAEGGALYNAGTATLKNVTFTGDAVLGGAGGASSYFGFYGGPIKGGEMPPTLGNGGLAGREGGGSLGPSDCVPSTGPSSLGVCRGLGGAGGNSGNGAPGGVGGAGEGGALYNGGSLTWTGGIVLQNSATGGSGGAAGATFTGTTGGDDGSTTPEGPNGTGGTTGSGGSGGAANGGAVWPDEVTSGSSAERPDLSAVTTTGGPTAITASQIMGSGNTVTGGTGGAAGGTYASTTGYSVGLSTKGSAGTASAANPSFLGSAEPLVSSVDPVQGPLGGGNAVVIHGSGFEHPALTLDAVYFRPAGDTKDKGLIAVSPVVVSDTEIDVVAPDASTHASAGKLDTTVVVEFTNSPQWPSPLDVDAGLAHDGTDSYLFAAYPGCKITATPPVQKINDIVDVAWISDATYFGETAYLSDVEPAATTPKQDYEVVPETSQIDPTSPTAKSFTYWFSLYPTKVTFGTVAPACSSKVTVTWTDEVGVTPSIAAGTVSVTYGAAGSLSGTVTGTAGTPTGSMTAKLGTTTIGTATLGSAGRFTVPIPARFASAGTHSVSLSYSGDAVYGHASGTVTYTVAAATPSTIIVNSGTTISMVRNVAKAVPIKLTFPAGVEPDVGSKVQIKKGSSVLDTATISASGTGTATIPADKLNAGSNQAITTTYLAVAGKTAAKSVTSKITVAKVSAKVTVSPTRRTVKYGAATTVTVTVTPASGTAYTPTGDVSLKDGGKTLASGTLKLGKLTLTLKAKLLGVKDYTLTVTYLGDSNTSAKSTTFAYTVTG